MELSPPLSNISIVVTRPAHQNIVICQQLQALGANTIKFPCIEICSNPLIDISTIKQQIPEQQILLFTSSNAVRQLYLSVPEANDLIHKDCLIVAVGASTANTLHQHGVDNVIYPSETSDSEAVLKLPALEKITQKMILIIKGIGGRELLYESLTQRGAVVQNVEIYQRQLPKLIDITPLSNKIDLILFTSSETVNNFLTLCSNSLQQSLLSCQTIVGHTRIAEKVTSLGFKKLPIIAATPTDADMLDAVQQWARQQ